MQEQEKLLLILAFYIINFPVLSDWGVDMQKPILLCFEENADVGRFIRCLCRSPCVIDVSTGVPAMKKLLCQKAKINSRGIFLKVDAQKSTEKQQEKESILFSVASEKQIEENAVTAATFFCCVRLIPERLKNDAFCIQIPPGMDFSSISIEMLKYLPVPAQLQKIKYIIEQYKWEYRLVASVAFLYPKMDEFGMVTEFTELIQYAGKLEEADQESTDLLELVEDCMARAMENGKFDESYSLPNLETELIERMDEFVFVKGDYMYLSEKFFQEIFSSSSEYISIRQIKRFLKAEGILKADKNGYTCKMNYCNPYGASERKVMMKLKIDAFHDAEGHPLKFYLQ